MKLQTIKHNETIISKYNKKDGYDYSTPGLVKIEVSAYSTFYYHNNPGNCKVCTVSSIHSPMLAKEEETIARLKELFVAVRKLVFKITTTDKRVVEKLRKHFSEVYTVEVPIGYNPGLQYHACFQTGNKEFPGYATYQPRLEKYRTKILSPLLNANARLTQAQAEKIMSYKHNGYRKRYIQKLVNGENLDI